MDQVKPKEMGGMVDKLKSWPIERWKAVAPLFFVAYLLSGVYYVPADQQAVRVRLGKLLTETHMPGLHYAWPWPMEEVVLLKVTEAQRLSTGGSSLDRTLGVSTPQQIDYFLTGDQNLVRVQASIQYYIRDPGGYLFRAESLERILQSILFRSISRVVGRRDVDEVLTTGRIGMQNEVQAALQRETERLGLGVTMTTVAFERMSPPDEVRDAFLSVADAREDRNRIVQDASGYANETLPRARGRAQKMLRQAEIYHTELVNRARGEAQRFLSVWREYRKHRHVTMTRLFLESMEEILPRIKKVILDDAGNPEGVDLDIFEVPTN